MAKLPGVPDWYAIEQKAAQREGERVEEEQRKKRDRIRAALKHEQDVRKARGLPEPDMPGPTGDGWNY